MDNVVLIVDDEEVNRMLLTKILESDYLIETAKDGAEALKMLKESPRKYAAVILDLIMPGMDGFTFLQHYGEDAKLQSIPVIVSTGDENQDNETHSLELGAWDFIRKPYNKKIIHFRLRNAIERSQMQIMRKLQYVEEYDSLTGLYRRDHFLKATREMLDKYPERQYVMIRLDIAKFNLVNSFYGMERGDHFLREVSDKIRKFMAKKEHVTYGRMRADVFAICMTYTTESELMTLSLKFRDEIREIIPEFDMIPVFGFYLIKDLQMEVNDMYDHAKLATKICKGNYMQNYAFYQDEMSRDIIQEQKIVNMTRPALEQEKFVLYLQPKYDIQKDKFAGAEVLVRWKDTDTGMISPGEFIPIFERNGFIIKLDYYVWEHTCQMIRGWLDKGYDPMPISVNVSRVSVYNPKLVDVICELVEAYDIPPELLQLELTESAYTNNPYMIRETMKQLQKKGFTILMDDFGSGYSSLNVLKDIAVDVLKIDMKFMSDTDIPGRGENILASVVNMAKTLEIPVVAEGVEKESQVLFLKNIGCEYVQGFYYAEPMPSDEYEKLAFCAG